MACGNNHVSRALISSAPRAAPRLAPPKDSPADMMRSGRLLGSGRVSDAFTQNRAEIGKPGWQDYRDANSDLHYETKVVRVQQEDGQDRYFSIREKLDVNGQVTDILAGEGFKAKIVKGGDHAHWVASDKRGVPAHRDTEGGLLAMLKEFGRHDFSGGVGLLGGSSVPFEGSDGHPRHRRQR